MSSNLDRILKDLEALRFNRLLIYAPYDKQREFHAAGKSCRERLFRAGNQLGKTWAGGMEAAMHGTGMYPDWWDGRVFDRPVNAWIAGESGENTRDGAQRMLFGRPEELGTGTVPKDRIGKVSKSAHGIADLFDFAKIRHVSGGWSTFKFKHYKQDRKVWGSETLDFLWFDEEPPEELYEEGMTRTNANTGPVWTTFTPLLGMSKVVRKFIPLIDPRRHDTVMTIDDVPMTAERKTELISSYEPHVRPARLYGEPKLGEGHVFPIEAKDITVEAFPIPKYWPVLGGMDFGFDHPFAAIKMAWDRDDDCIYVTNAYKETKATPIVHSGSIKPWGEIPWAWPHDGHVHDKGSGEQLSAQYRAHGLKMLPSHSTFPDGTMSFEAGIMEMLERMQTQRLKVFAHLGQWFEEFGLYHRKDGKVVKVFDDLLSATRIAMMAKRRARTVEKRRVEDQVHAQSGYSVHKW